MEIYGYSSMKQMLNPTYGLTQPYKTTDGFLNFRRSIYFSFQFIWNYMESI